MNILSGFSIRELEELGNHVTQLVSQTNFQIDFLLTIRINSISLLHDMKS